jgi:hypothetical protein
LSVIEPFVPPQVVGLLKLVDAMVGIGFTVAVVVPAADVQPFNVAVTEYTPLFTGCAFTIVGAATLLENEPGPVQLNVTPGVVDVALNISVDPWHIGELLEAAGIAGVGGSVRLIGPSALEGQLLSDALMLV